MKLLDVSGDSYVYSVSYRLWISSVFAPCTTVAPMNRDASKAVAFIWKRKERGWLAKLHYETLAAVMEAGLKQLRWLAVLAFLFKDSRYKGECTSVAALKLVHHDWLSVAVEPFPFSAFVLSSLDSLVPLTGISHTEWEKAVRFWQTALNPK
jgi:hypothetical protein